MTIPSLEGLIMKYIRYGVYTGRENMHIDSELLDEAIETNCSEPIFRLYGWSPKCISIGRNQNETNIADVDVVRRVTGGRALLHDDEITYSCIVPVSYIPDGESIIASYKYISSYLIRFFDTLGVKLNIGENSKKNTKFDYCMMISTGADVCYEGKKIIGSAQFRKNGYILQHGSILFSYDKILLEKLFKEKVSTDSITCVREILPNLTKEEFVEEFEKFIIKEKL